MTTPQPTEQEIAEAVHVLLDEHSDSYQMRQARTLLKGVRLVAVPDGAVVVPGQVWRALSILESSEEE